MSDDTQKRFCVCGYYVVGNTVFRLAAMKRHHKTGEHDRRSRHNAYASAVWQAWAAHEADVERGSE